MHKTAGESKVRHVQTPGSKAEVKHIDARRRMPATSRIPVSRTVWAELSELKKPGETFDHLLAEMIEREKKNRFFEDMDRIEKRGKFVAMEW
jgi:predicted CopG family antitoxin